MKNFLLITLISITLINNVYTQDKIKLYAIYTPSHEYMMNEFFLPSIKDDYDIILEKHDQQCQSGDFMSTGWLETMIHKVDVVIRGIKENWGKIFIHSDVDIQFFRPTQDLIQNYMADNDFAIQKNDKKGAICAGFFACRGNEKTLALWSEIRARLIDATKDPIKAKNENIHDQSILESLIRKSNPFNIKWTYLPPEFYVTKVVNAKYWAPGEKLIIPSNIVMHHANWTIGLENKIALLSYVKENVNLVEA